MDKYKVEVTIFKKECSITIEAADAKEAAGKVMDMPLLELMQNMKVSDVTRGYWCSLIEEQAEA